MTWRVTFTTNQRIFTSWKRSVYDRACFLLRIYYESTHFLHLGNVRSMTGYVLTCIVTAETWVIAAGKAIREGRPSIPQRKLTIHERKHVRFLTMTQTPEEIFIPTHLWYTVQKQLVRSFWGFNSYSKT